MKTMKGIEQKSTGITPATSCSAQWLTWGMMRSEESGMPGSAGRLSMTAQKAEQGRAGRLLLTRSACAATAGRACRVPRPTFPSLTFVPKRGRGAFSRQSLPQSRGPKLSCRKLTRVSLHGNHSHRQAAQPGAPGHHRARPARLQQRSRRSMLGAAQNQASHGMEDAGRD